MTKYMLNLAKSKSTCHFKTFLLLPLFLVVVRGCVKAMWMAKVSKRERKTAYMRDGGGGGGESNKISILLQIYRILY